jgi:hypothetical protein
VQPNGHSSLIYTWLGARSFRPYHHFLLPSSPSTIPMERGNSPQRSEEVDDSPMTQRRRMGVGPSLGAATSCVLAASQWGPSSIVRPSPGLRSAHRGRWWSEWRSRSSFTRRQRTLRGGRMSSSVSWRTLTTMASISLFPSVSFLSSFTSLF